MPKFVAKGILLLLDIFRIHHQLKEQITLAEEQLIGGPQGISLKHS